MTLYATQSAAESSRWSSTALDRRRTTSRLAVRPTLRWEIERARRVFRQIEELEDGWDGYGALSVPHRTRLNAWHAFEEVKRVGLIPEVSPRSNGTVSFEWEAEGVVAHLQIGVKSYSMYVDSGRRETEYFSGEFPVGLSLALAALSGAVREQTDSLLSLSE